MIRIAIVLVTSLLLGACASGPRVYTDYNPDASGAGYSTFGYFEELGTDNSQYRSLVTQHLKAAVSREMGARGYRQSDDPDLLINFYVHAEDKTRVNSVPRPTGYYGFRGGYYNPWAGYAVDTYVTEFTEGTLNIDLVDAGSKTLIWQGAAVGTVSESDRRNPKPAIDEAVAAIFAEYPFSAAP